MTTTDAAIRALLDRAAREIDSGLLPSCQVAVARGGELLEFAALGDATTADRYTIFSCTKGFVAGAVWMLLGDGSLRLDQRVAEVVPEFGTNGKDVVTVEMLLTHTGGFPSAPMSPTTAATRESRLAQMARWRLNWEPGTRFEYHPTAGHWVLGELIEQISGTDLRSFLRTRIVEPLGLPRFELAPPLESQGDVLELVAVGELPTPEEMEAATGVAGIDLASMLGEVTTENLLQFNDPAARAVGFPGAGGVATAADLALYYQGVLHDPAGLWDPALLDRATRHVWCDLPDPVLGHPAHRGLGIQIAGDPPDAQRRGFGHGCSPATFGHDGAGGQIAWVDPVSGISLGYLTNGLDRHVLREARRKIGIGSRAAAIASPD